MKITYPECQIEISTKEVIDLLDYFREIKPSTEVKIERKELEEMMNRHFVERTKSRKHENPKEPENHEEEPAPTFEPGGFVPDDEQPEPKPYPNLTDHEAIVQRGEGFKDLIMQGLKEAEAQGKLPEMQIPTEEEPSPVEIPIERKNKSTKTSPKKKASGKPKKVQVLFETGWKTFSSISQAAKAIDARLNHLSHALLNGKTCNGHQVRYHSEMDDIMAEIKERDRQPYQPSKPVR